MNTRAALVVIDVQNGFVNEHSRPAVPVVQAVADAWTRSGGAAIFTRYHNYDDSPYVRLVGWRGLMQAPDTDLAEPIAQYAEGPNSQVLDKTTYTAFTEAGRALFAPYTDLYLCGIATDGCVLKTALDAFDLGYTPWVIEDACASNATRHPAAEVHRSALTLMSRLIGGGQLIRSESVLDALASQQLPLGA